MFSGDRGNSGWYIESRSISANSSR